MAIRLVAVIIKKFYVIHFKYDCGPQLMKIALKIPAGLRHQHLSSFACKYGIVLVVSCKMMVPPLRSVVPFKKQYRRGLGLNRQWRWLCIFWRTANLCHSVTKHINVLAMDRFADIWVVYLHNFTKYFHSLPIRRGCYRSHGPPLHYDADCKTQTFMRIRACVTSKVQFLRRYHYVIRRSTWYAGCYRIVLRVIIRWYTARARGVIVLVLSSQARFCLVFHFRFRARVTSPRLAFETALTYSCYEPTRTCTDATRFREIRVMRLRGGARERLPFSCHVISRARNKD